LSYGPFSQRFERLFADIHQSRHALFCNSGTSALHVAVTAMKELHGWKDGMRFCARGNFHRHKQRATHNGLRPVFVDVERDTYNIDPTQLENT